jgi:large subunit ribosomal protein L35
MAYKFKPRKSVKQRFKVTATGKLKHQRTLRRHLLSGRSGDKKRVMCKPDILVEGHAKPLRLAMGISGKNPARAAHRRKLAAKAAAAEQSAA